MPDLITTWDPLRWCAGAGARTRPTTFGSQGPLFDGSKLVGGGRTERAGTGTAVGQLMSVPWNSGWKEMFGG